MSLVSISMDFQAFVLDFLVHDSKLFVFFGVFVRPKILESSKIIGFTTVKTKAKSISSS